MLTIEEYCRRIDISKPDFFKEMKKFQLCRPALKDKSELNGKEQKIFAGMEADYNASYTTAYTDIFEKNFRYREPLLLNLDKPEIADHPEE
jgi:hypothetical protein